MAQRSTKGASKQRRDAINDKIAQMRELIPVSEAVRPRLSQLQVMALLNAYIAKSNLFERRYPEADSRSTFYSDLYDMIPTLPGFLLIVSVTDGRILYVSESVSEYLGNSAVDILTQNETVFELIDDRDREILRQAMHKQQQQQQQQVLTGSSPSAAATEPWMRDIHAREMLYGCEEKVDRLSFTCRMNVAARGFRNTTAQSTMKFAFDRQKIMQVTGHFARPRSTGYCAQLSYSSDQTSNHVLIAYCTPHLGVFNGSGSISGFASADNIEGNTNAFYSLHQADMKFIRVESNGEFHIGYNRNTIKGKSWYEMIHPADIDIAKGKHMELLGDYQIGDTSSVKSCCVRIQSARGNFLWLHIVLRIQDAEGGASVPLTDILPLPAMLNVTNAQPLIICTNHVIDEQMAVFLRARENEAQLATKNEIPSNGYPMSAIGSTIGPIEDFELSEILSTGSVETEIVGRRSSSSGNKRRFIDAGGNGVVSRKMPKVIEEENSLEMIPTTQNMLLSMPSPPGPQWDFEIHDRSNQGLATRTTMYGNCSMQSAAYHGVLANNCTSTSTINSFISVPSMQIQESFYDSRSPPLAALSDSLVPETYMAVPDFHDNNFALGDSVEFPNMYGNEPVVKSSGVLSYPTSHPIHSKNSPANNSGLILPELDQSVVESVLESLETNQHPASCFQRNVVANPATVEIDANEDSTSLIQQLLYLGQEFLKSECGSIYNHANPLNFV